MTRRARRRSTVAASARAGRPAPRAERATRGHRLSTHGMATVALVVALLTTARAAAQGLVVGPESLPPAARAALQTRVADARATDGEAFEAFAHATAVALDVRGRAPSPRARLAASLRRLGPRGLWPMVEAAALHAPRLEAASSAQRTGVELALLEAIGGLRDPRARDVLLATFATAQSQPVRQAAAVALGRLCDEPAAQALMRRTGAATGATDHGARVAAITGLGHCRTLRSAQALASELRLAVRRPGSEPADAEIARVAADSLGMLGSSWAWRALASQNPPLGGEREAEGLVVRAIAARALLDSFVRGSEPLARTAARSLAMVDHPQSAQLAANLASAATPERRAALERVVARLAAGRGADPAAPDGANRD